MSGDTSNPLKSSINSPVASSTYIPFLKDIFSAGLPTPGVKAGPVMVLGKGADTGLAVTSRFAGALGALGTLVVPLGTLVAPADGLVGPYGVNGRDFSTSTPVLIPAFSIILFLRDGLRSLRSIKSPDSFASAKTSMSCNADFFIPDNRPLPDFARSSM